MILKILLVIIGVFLGLLLGTMALHDQFGFGGARLGKWIDKMNELKECYEKGLVSVQDLQSIIKNETGIEIKF